MSADRVLQRPARRDAGRRARVGCTSPWATGELASFKVSDFAAYERQVRHRAGRVRRRRSRRLPVRRPLPRAGRALCHLSVAANLHRPPPGRRRPVAGGGHRPASTPGLKAAGITTRRAWPPAPSSQTFQLRPAISLARVQQQARLQVASEDQGRILYELVDPERDDEGALVANRGLLALPEPVDGRPVLRHRRVPPLLRRRQGVRPAVPVRHRRHRRPRRGGQAPLPAVLGVRPGRARSAPSRS